MTDVQVNLRIPLDLKDKIHNYAKDNHRSLNAELVERLLSSFSSSTDSYLDSIKMISKLLERHQQSPRLSNISSKLNFLLTQINSISHESLTISSVAHQMNYEQVGEVESWFLGKIEPTFNQLNKVAILFNCSAEWLLFDKGSPFPAKYETGFRSFEDFVIFCTDNEEHERVTNISFIRNLSRAGELIIIKQFNSHHCQVYKTSIHVSDIVGATGSQFRAALVLALHALYKSNWTTKVKSYLLENKSYDEIASGEVHPLKVLSKCHFVPWMDDIWDSSMYKNDKTNYWEGWQSLCEDIAYYISIDEKLTKDRQLIRSNEHQVFELINSRYREFFKT